MLLLKKIFSVLLAISIPLTAVGCEKKGSIIEFQCFNTEVYVQSTQNIPTKVESAIKSCLIDLENKFTTQSQTSFISNFNRSNQGEIFNLDQSSFQVLSLAKKIYDFSDGYYDASVYPLAKLYGFAPYKYSASYTPPTQEQINAELKKVNFNDVILDYDLKTLTKNSNDVKIDLGGIVKGYAVDLVAQILKDNKITTGYVNIGGSSLNLLSVDTLGVRHPRKPLGNAILTVNCKGQKNLSVSTSGDYEKYYKDNNGNKYCHLINPKTGLTATTGVASATILGVSGAESDALTTAICLLNHNLVNAENSHLITFLKKITQTYSNCSIYVVFDDGQNKLLITNKIQGENFTLHDTEYSIVNI